MAFKVPEWLKGLFEKGNCYLALFKYTTFYGIYKEWEQSAMTAPIYCFYKTSFIWKNKSSKTFDYNKILQIDSHTKFEKRIPIAQ